MADNKLIETLKDIGLSENEAKVYFATLSLGPTTVLSISRSAEMKRTTVYSIVESLKQKGLLNIELKGIKQLYVAENPEKLESVLEKRKDEFKNNLPEFLALYNLSGGESFIKYHEGLESVKSIYESLLKEVRPKEDYLVIGSQERWFELDPKFFQSFIEKRAKLNINTRLLFQDSKIARDHKRFEKNYNEQVKILPKETMLSTNLVLTSKKLVIQQLHPPIMAIVIENKSIIKMHKELFEIIWKSIPDES
ncbi:hypothetical protein COB64_01520 [Candidatus Wolfebacteria bacterium]|nr:MAG: hypothetical protein COB64_01520 [Candidatus Wolfebacteria bacterium]